MKPATSAGMNGLWNASGIGDLQRRNEAGDERRDEQLPF